MNERYSLINGVKMARLPDPTLRATILNAARTVFKQKGFTSTPAWQTLRARRVLPLADDLSLLQDQRSTRGCPGRGDQPTDFNRPVPLLAEAVIFSFA